MGHLSPSPFSSRSHLSPSTPDRPSHRLTFDDKRRFFFSFHLSGFRVKMFIVKEVKSFSQFGWENGNFFFLFSIRKFVAAANLLKNILFIIHWMTYRRYRIIFKRTFHSSFTQFFSITPFFSPHHHKNGRKILFRFFSIFNIKKLSFTSPYTPFSTRKMRKVQVL